MYLRDLFTDHPRSVGETYGDHMLVALSFAGPLTKAAAAALVHAFALPLRANGKPDDQEPQRTDDPALRHLPQSGFASARSPAPCKSGSYRNEPQPRA
jgi:Family of unknown function (DUF6356)